jgi:hypothetical protein
MVVMTGTIDLGTTNAWLAVLAIASVLQTLLLVVVAIAGYVWYRRATVTMREIQIRHLDPFHEQVDRILGDVSAITARVSQQTERVDHAITGTIDRVDETAERVKDRVRDKVSQATGVVRGIRAVIASLLTTDPGTKPRAEAGGRA